MRVRGLGAGHAGRPRGQDARGDPPVPGQRADRDGAAARVSRRRSPRGCGNASLRGHGADGCCAAAVEYWPRTRCARAPTRTPGGPKPRTARSNRATSSTSTPTRWAWAGRSSASPGRSPCGAALARAARDLPRILRLARTDEGARPAGDHVRGARRDRPRSRPSGICRNDTSAWSTGSGSRRRTPASASRPTGSPTATASSSRACSWSSSSTRGGRRRPRRQARRRGPGHGRRDRGPGSLPVRRRLAVLMPLPACPGQRLDSLVRPRSRRVTTEPEGTTCPDPCGKGPSPSAS